MSISAIITRGYGSFATVNFIPVRGYLATTPAAATPDTHDLPFRYDEIKKYRKSLLARQKALQKIEEAKRHELQKLRKTIVEAIYPEEIAEKEQISLPESKLPEILARSPSYLNIEHELNEILRQLSVLKRQLQDEDDIHAILLATY